MNRDLARSPGPQSPRLRPSGPRSRRPNQSSSLSSKPNTQHAHAPSEQSDESLPGYSGRNSPAVSSLAGSVSSPIAASFDPPAAGSVPESQPEPEAPEVRSRREQAIQTDSPTPATTRAPTPAVKVILKSPTLTPPSPVSFESVPISWRGMTLESAKWSLTSEQLQEIVSRAIRNTAQESFIRLLPVKTLDEELAAELERLETLKATTQSQYRFNVHRRTMVLQSLLALASGGDCDCDVLCSLTTRLADITSSCDRLMAELLHVADQKAQIHRVQDVHVSSALAMALRKLNGSYAKRTMELREARERAEQLKAELNEAWAVAQDMAEEMDELENFHSGFSSGEEDFDDDSRRLDDSVRMAEVIGITGRAVAMKATLTHLEAARNREREYQSERVRRVSAARKRSSLASKASLRLPKSSKSSVADAASLASRVSTRRIVNPRSPGSATSPTQLGPTRMPTLRLDTRSRKVPKDGSFLELSETRPVSPNSASNSQPLPPLLLVAAGPPDAANKPSPASSHSQQPSLDFNLPPITVHPADNDALPNPHPEEPVAEAGHPSTLPGRRSLSSRRVHSLQPPARRSLDEGTGIQRAASDPRRFDAWPWPSIEAKVERRQSMPLSGPSVSVSASAGASLRSGTSGGSVSVLVTNVEHHSDPGHAGAPSRVESPPLRVFSPPPQPTRRPPAPPSTSSRQAPIQATSPLRIFSLSPKVSPPAEPS